MKLQDAIDRAHRVRRACMKYHFPALANVLSSSINEAEAGTLAAYSLDSLCEQQLSKLKRAIEVDIEGGCS